MHTDCRVRHAPGVDSHGGFSQGDLWDIWEGSPAEGCTWIVSETCKRQ